MPMLSSQSALTPHGIIFENEATGEFGKVATVFDPEGNRINMDEPPKGSGIADVGSSH